MAQEAGFLATDTAIDPGTQQRASAACAAKVAASGGVKLDAPPAGRTRKNQVNKGRLNLTLVDVVQAAGGAGKDLEARMQRLAKEFGYEL